MRNGYFLKYKVFRISCISIYFWSLAAHRDNTSILSVRRRTLDNGLLTETHTIRFFHHDSKAKQWTFYPAHVQATCCSSVVPRENLSEASHNALPAAISTDSHKYLSVRVDKREERKSPIKL